MSQRSEKHRRQIEDLREEIRFNAIVQKLRADRIEHAIQEIRGIHRRAARAERQSGAWRRATYLATAALALAILTVAAVWVKATMPPPEITLPPVAAVQAIPEVPEAVEDRGGGEIEQALPEQANILENVTVTHYCICRECCGRTPDDPAYGITASGRAAVPYVSVGVDPAVIPLGSDVLVDYGDGELQYYRADDTGNLRGSHIDLCVGSHREALEAGVRTATVWWVEAA